MVRLSRSVPAAAHQRAPGEAGSMSKAWTEKEQPSRMRKIPRSWCWTMTRSDSKPASEVLRGLHCSAMDDAGMERRMRRRRMGAIDGGGWRSRGEMEIEKGRV